MRHQPRGPAAGFTLIELLVVMVIIGILLSFILVAGIAGVRNAQSAATKALLTKLDAAIADRLDALLSQRPDVTAGHMTMAGVTGTYNGGLQRAQVIAQIDMLRAQMPDTFFVQVTPSAMTNPPTTGSAVYPLNFAANPNPYYTGLTPNPNAYFLPIGAPDLVNRVNVTGVYGASFSAQAGLMKGFGYGPLGYDGADNDGDGFIDDFYEGTLAQGTPGGAYAPDPALAKTIINNLAQHLPKTARSEALYAMLVEGTGPLGSYFSKDDFTAKEVQDTDGDGLPEFVDAWGEPLQFYRWPFYYDSYLQRGYLPYNGLPDNRDQNSLDPNQQLVAPLWFLPGGATSGTNNQPPSGPPPSPAFTFQNLFFSLVDPNSTNNTTANSGVLWDRSSTYGRRAYNSRPLILSSGPDKMLGVARLGVDYSQLGSVGDGSGAAVAVSATNLLLIENQAARGVGPARTGTFLEKVAPGSDTSVLLNDWASDDLSNQNISAPGGPG